MTECHIVWGSADALKNFQLSTSCIEVLQRLRCGHGSPARLPCIQWDLGFHLEDHLSGRITLTILVSDSDREFWRAALLRTTKSFMPKGCIDIRSWPPFSW
jgi:hypothetical protein